VFGESVFVIHCINEAILWPRNDDTNDICEDLNSLRGDAKSYLRVYSTDGRDDVERNTSRRILNNMYYIPLNSWYR